MWKCRRRIAPLLIISIFIAYSIYILLYSHVSESRKPYSTKPKKKREGPPKRILFDTAWYNYPHIPFMEEATKLCPHCIFTENRSYFESSDAVVFHGVNLRPGPPVHRRQPNQIWVWFFMEAPRHTYYPVINISLAYRNMFNWTMTYRHDSDIVMPYGLFVPNSEIPKPNSSASWAYIPSESGLNNGFYDKKFFEMPTIEQLSNRSMAAWIVSHCRTGAAREQIAGELKKYISLDLYGSCGRKKCRVPRFNRSKSGFTGVDCRFEISSKYKFYLSFENSPCEDYVTEKYFDTLYTDMIPIVLGSANYKALAPAKSYINVGDFENIEALAKYLLYLDKNPKEYLKYFEWRKSYWVQNNGFTYGYCALCDKLWDMDSKTTTATKTYANIFDWFIRRSDFETSGKNACDWIQEDLY